MDFLPTRPVPPQCRCFSPRDSWSMPPALPCGLWVVGVDGGPPHGPLWPHDPMNPMPPHGPMIPWAPSGTWPHAPHGSHGHPLCRITPHRWRGGGSTKPGDPQPYIVWVDASIIGTLCMATKPSTIHPRPLPSPQLLTVPGSWSLGSSNQQLLIHICVYIILERERERDKERDQPPHHSRTTYLVKSPHASFLYFLLRRAALPSAP